MPLCALYILTCFCDVCSKPYSSVVCQTRRRGSFENGIPRLVEEADTGGLFDSGYIARRKEAQAVCGEPQKANAKGS